jgi:hypothetical protein
MNAFESLKHTDMGMQISCGVHPEVSEKVLCQEYVTLAGDDVLVTSHLPYRFVAGILF